MLPECLLLLSALFVLGEFNESPFSRNKKINCLAAIEECVVYKPEVQTTLFALSISSGAPFMRPCAGCAFFWQQLIGKEHVAVASSVARVVENLAEITCEIRAVPTRGIVYLFFLRFTGSARVSESGAFAGNPASEASGKVPAALFL